MLFSHLVVEGYYPRILINNNYSIRSGPWGGTRSVNRILKVEDDAGWFRVLSNGGIKNVVNIQLNRDALPAVHINPPKNIIK